MLNNSENSGYEITLTLDRKISNLQFGVIAVYPTQSGASTVYPTQSGLGAVYSTPCESSAVYPPAKKSVKGAVSQFQCQRFIECWEMYCPRKSLHFTHCKISFWIKVIRFDLIRRSCQINWRCRRPKYDQVSLDQKYAL
jgi:hypothetical protein